MEERYWEKFMTTGKIDDYLNYRIHRECSGITPDRISGMGGISGDRPEENAGSDAKLRNK